MRSIANSSKARETPFDEKLLIGLQMFAEEEAELRAEFSAKHPSESPDQILQRVKDHYAAIEAAEPNPWKILSDEEAAKFL